MGIEEAAKAAARIDAKRGDHAVGAWLASLILWASEVKKGHLACGPLTKGEDLPEDIDRGRVVAALVCPVHGRIESEEAPKLTPFKET